MANYPIKYVTDANNDRVLPLTHTDAVKNDDGTLLTTILEQKVSIVQNMITGTSVTQQLSPNTYYSFGEVTALTITLGPPVSGVNNEYVFEFDSGITATTLTVPAGIVWQGLLYITTDMHYEVSIKYDASTQIYYGLITEW